MRKILSKLSLSVIIIVLVIPSLLSPFSIASAYNKATAESYLKFHADNPWTTIGLTALNAGNIPLDYLKNFSGTNAIDFAAPILAITATGNDPKTFGAQDLVAKLKTFHQQNQLGDAGVINDDIFGILALISSGEPVSDSAIVDAKNFILANQKLNGGWGFATGGGTDSNITAAAIVALKASELPSTDEKIIKALNYLKTAQNADGGFTYDPESSFGTASDSSSTAWVLWALNALGINESSWSENGHTPSDYLSSTQTSSGYFEWQASADENSFSATNTAYAVIALEGRSLPLKIIQPARKQFNFRIEGSTETVCQGHIAGAVALDIVKNASSLCGFSYHIKDTSFGPYLDKINDDEAAGSSGWLYWINYSAPSIGAADYQLRGGDEVLWAFGDFNMKPTRLTLDPVEINSGQDSRAMVEYRDGDNWKALDLAKVFIGSSDFTTANDGKAPISGPDGYYKIFAKKDGHIKSNEVLLKIGNPPAASINLSVNVQNGQVEGTSTTPSSLSFTVEPSNLDFGNLATGKSAEKTLTVKNTGSLNLQLNSEVTQGQLFKDNLKLGGKIWQQFQADVPASGQQDIAASLAVPQGYQNGRQAGTLVLWASVK